jgi:hypothetical protein
LDLITTQRKKLEHKYMIQFDLSWFEVANEKLERERERFRIHFLKINVFFY